MTSFQLLKPSNAFVFIILLTTLQTSVCSAKEFAEVAKKSEYVADNSFYATVSVAQNATIKLLEVAK